MAASLDCFRSSSSLLLNEDWNLAPNNNNTRMKETKIWLPFKTWCSLSVPRCAAYHKGNWISWCLYGSQVLSFPTFTHASVLLIKTTTQNRLDKAKQIFLYFIQWLRHFAVCVCVCFFFFQTLVDVFEKKHHKDHLEDMLIEVRRRVSGTVCQVSPSHSTLRYKVFLWISSDNGYCRYLGMIIQEA